MTPTPYKSPATHGFRYNQVRFKASHNTFEKRVSVPALLHFDFRRPKSRGFRGLELDLHQNTRGCGWCVRHERGKCKSPWRSTGRWGTSGCLRLWLKQLLTWSDRNPGHDVITLTLDLKRVSAGVGQFPGQFDAFLERHFDPNRLFVPGEVGSLWPRLGDLTGRFLFCLSGRKDGLKATYAQRENRLCFADIGLGPGKLPDPNDPRLFLNYNWREWEKDTGHEFERPEGRPYVLRAYYLRKDPALGSWEGAVEGGVNVLATDWLSRLAVGSEPFDEI